MHTLLSISVHYTTHSNKNTITLGVPHIRFQDNPFLQFKLFGNAPISMHLLEWQNGYTRIVSAGGETAARISMHSVLLEVSSNARNSAFWQ